MRAHPNALVGHVDTVTHDVLPDLLEELAPLGGVAAPASATARLRTVLLAALKHGAEELEKPRSGYGAPVEVAIAAGDGVAAGRHAGRGALPRRPRGRGRARPGCWSPPSSPRSSTSPSPARPPAPATCVVRAGDLGGFLLLALPGRVAPEDLEELGPLAFDDHAAGTRPPARPRRRDARPAARGPELREPIGAHHPLRVAEAVARLGGRPEDPRSVEELEEAVLARAGGRRRRAVRPHEDPDAARRVARRILQRLDGMGKWGGYHTDFAHLARGFAGNDRALAQEVGEALLEAGLLAEKPSVGQRHVFLNPRRAAEIRRLIDEGAVPAGMRLPSA